MSRILVTGGSGFIGTNLVATARCLGHTVTNLDTASPLFAPHAEHWITTDITDRAALIGAFDQIQPDAVIHLAAITDCNPKHDLSFYESNVAGTLNVLEAVRRTPSVERLIVTSTQFVCRPGYKPASDDDYAPHTPYGRSKVITEQETRAAGLTCAWSIIRPTNIWGPWLLRHLPFYRLMRRGLYLHPGGDCIRTWGFVGTVVDQILRLLELPTDRVDGRTLYVGDAPRPLREISNAFSRGLRGTEVRVAPSWLLRGAARGGDVLRGIGIPFPLHSQRFRSMVEDYIVDMEPTYELLGPPAYSIDEGVQSVAKWLDVWKSGSHDWQPPVSRREGWHALEAAPGAESSEDSAGRKGVAQHRTAFHTSPFAQGKPSGNRQPSFRSGNP